MENNKNIEEMLAISIRGASHFVSGKPVQDYSLAEKSDDYSIAVVCDGHGNDKHFRSELGSEFAAKVIRDKFTEFFDKNKTYSDFSQNTDKKLSRLKLSIITAWQMKIEKYTKEHPFTEEELNKKASPSFKYRMDYDIAQPYGTTALAVLVCKDYYLVMMVGDGAIAKIDDKFKASIVTFPGKKVFDDQPHSATDSLCEEDSFEKIFFAYDEIKDEILAFGLCSDGMSEAFDSDSVLLRKFNNYLNYYAEIGLEKAKPPIEAQLNKLSQISTMKDDISLAFATLNLDKFRKPEEPPKKTEEKKELESKENNTPDSNANTSETVTPDVNAKPIESVKPDTAVKTTENNAPDTAVKPSENSKLETKEAEKPKCEFTVEYKSKPDSTFEKAEDKTENNITKLEDNTSEKEIPDDAKVEVTKENGNSVNQLLNNTSGKGFADFPSNNSSNSSDDEQNAEGKHREGFFTFHKFKR